MSNKSIQELVAHFHAQLDQDHQRYSDRIKLLTKLRASTVDAGKATFQELQWIDGLLIRLTGYYISDFNHTSTVAGREPFGFEEADDPATKLLQVLDELSSLMDLDKQKS